MGVWIEVEPWDLGYLKGRLDGFATAIEIRDILSRLNASFARRVYVAPTQAATVPIDGTLWCTVHDAPLFDTGRWCISDDGDADLPCHGVALYRTDSQGAPE